MNSLDDLRNSLDSIDKKILELFAERLAIVGEVGRIKKERGLPFFDQARWEHVIESRQQMAKKLGLNPKFTQKLLKLIHTEALKTEENTNDFS